MSRFFSWIQAGPKVRRPNRFRPQVVQLEDRNCPAVFTVTTTADIAGPPTPGELSLRQAIDAVNKSADLNNTIILAAGTYGITVTSATENNNSGGDFDIGQINGTPLNHGLNLTIEGQGPNSTIINGNQADRVFQIFGNNSGVHVTFNDLEITGGNVNGVGGGVYLNDSGQAANVDGLTFNDVLVTRNTANGNGGGVSADSGSITLSGSIVSNNTATGNNAGGGIYDNGGDISLSASAVTGNTATNDAGGIQQDGNGTVTIIHNSSVTNNMSTFDGGGLDDEATTGALTIGTGANGDVETISGNIAGRDGGGLEYDGSTISISNSLIENNRAGSDGGGINTDGSGGSMTISGSIISGDRANTSSGDGGGLYNNYVDNITIVGSAFNNDAANRGGAIFDNDATSVTVSNTDLSGNVASDSGGGMYLDAQSTTVYHLTDVTLNNDAAFTGSGGAIDMELGTSLNLDTVHVQNDTAGGSSGGGGIFNNTTDTLVFDNSTFTNDLATGGPGGAVEDTSASSVTISGSILSGNRAEGGSGGGMESQSGSSTGLAILTGSAFNNDLATNFGGGYDFDGTNLSVQNSQFTGDKASTGGGLYSAGSTTSLVASTIENDTASSAGGGVEVANSGGQLTVDHSVISGNIAQNGLGGGLNTNALDVTVEYSQLDNDAATAGGGGINLFSSSSNPSWEVEYSTIAFDNAGNSADGGGIRLTSTNTTAGLLTVLNSTIAGDIAGANGGGVAIEGASNKLAVEFLFATLDSNQAVMGGGIYNAETTAGKLQLGNTIVADDSASSAANGPDIFSAGAIADLVLQPGSQTIGHNIIGTTTGYTGLTNGTAGDQLGTDPKLNPIANNGGPTLTNSLQANSPAVDAGTSPSDVTAITTTDQRGVTRPDGGTASDNPDVGAFESNLG